MKAMLHSWAEPGATTLGHDPASRSQKCSQ